MNEMVQLFKNKIGNNPEAFLMNMMGNFGGNPIFSNLFKSAKSGDTKSVETFARNLFKEQGRDFDSEFANFMSNFK